MTTVDLAISAWATRPAGKAIRIALAALGMGTATLLLMTAALVASGSWALVILGVGLSVLSVRAALAPNISRLGLLALAIIAGPVVISSL